MRSYVLILVALLGVILFATGCESLKARLTGDVQYGDPIE